MKRALILTTERTGGNALADCLAQTGVCGFPGKFIQGKQAEYQLWLGTGEGLIEVVDAGGIEKAYIERGLLGDVCCVKAHVGYLMELIHYTGWRPTFDWLRSIDYFIYLRRWNFIKQAISFYFAQQDHRWQEHYDVPAVDVPYSYDRIMECIIRFEMHKTFIDTFLAEYEIDPLTLFFEEIVRDWPLAVLQILQFLDVEPPDGIASISPRILEINEPRKRQYYERFLKARK